MGARVTHKLHTMSNSKRLQALISSKLGRCSKCMRLSLAGAMVGWLASTVVHLLWPGTFLWYLSLLSASSFTLLWLLHVVTFAARVVAGARLAAQLPASRNRPSYRQSRQSGLTIAGTSGDAANFARMRLSPAASTVTDSRVGALPATRTTHTRKPAAATMKPPPGKQISRREVLSLFYKGAAVAALASLPSEQASRVAAEKSALFQGAPACRGDCGCYFSTNCGARQYCNYRTILGGGGTSHCCQRGKLDGVCATKSAVSAYWSQVEVSAVTLAISKYFQAYLVPVARGEGRPDETWLREAVNVRIHANAQVGNLWHSVLQELVHNALDIVLGYDFEGIRSPVLTVQDFGFGNIRGLRDPVAATALVRATYLGIKGAVERRSSNEISKNIREFWVRYPRYVPMHTGRCYPHGHPGQTDALTCQIDALVRLVEVVLARDGEPTRPPTPATKSQAPTVSTPVYRIPVRPLAPVPAKPLPPAL